MTYVLTVHWKDDRWIKLQHAFVKNHLTSDYQLHAFLTEIDHEFYQYFDVVHDYGDPSHASKLNILAHSILQKAADADRMIFLDGDAFPIRPLDAWLDNLLDSSPLAAVQRLENNGDCQPHPCFCVTTAGFWRQIQGDWEEGPWTNRDGNTVTDVGGKLLQLLNAAGVTWRPILRSNTIDLDPLMYGVYEDHIYHHGAGFRVLKGGRIALINAGEAKLRRRLDGRILLKLTPLKYRSRVINSWFHPVGRLRRRVRQRAYTQDAGITARFMDDPASFIAHLLR